MITYKETLQNKSEDNFSNLLREASEYFDQKQVNIIGEGFKDILTTNTLFEEYVDKLTQGLDATEEATVRTLMENAKMNILQESGLSGIAPISSLTLPIIRKMWAKVALKYAIPTEPVNIPAFSVVFNRPYIIGEKGEKLYLPDALRDNNNGLAERKRLSQDPISLPADGTDLLALVGSSIETGDTVDKKFSITSVKMTVKDSASTNDEDVKVNCSIKLDINRRLYGEITGKHSTGHVTKDVLMGAVDLDKGLLTLTSLKGTIKEVEVLGWVSSEAHNTATNVSFDIDRRDIEIGTGHHIEASLPIEFLQDTMAMYSIDGSTEVVDIMSNTVSQKLDQEIITFLDKAYIGTGAKYQGKFDIHPPAQYAVHPKEWLEEIKRVIDYYAQKMKTDSYYYSGYFVIVGNPLDTMILPNVTWTFNNVTDNQNGIEVEYSIGAMSGGHRYSIISSDLIPQGELTMFFVPTTDKFKTVVYYPYTFNVVNNYLNTRMQNVPSVMMTKRHTLEEFMPIMCKIKIENNDGTLVRA